METAILTLGCLLSFETRLLICINIFTEQLHTFASRHDRQVRAKGSRIQFGVNWNSICGVNWAKQTVKFGKKVLIHSMNPFVIFFCLHFLSISTVPCVQIHCKIVWIKVRIFIRCNCIHRIFDQIDSVKIIKW